MRFSQGKVRLNGEPTMNESIWDGLYPSAFEALLDNIAKVGFSDGRSGSSPLDRTVIEALTRLRLTKEKIKNRALYRTLQRKIEVLREQLKRLCERIGHLHGEIKELRPKVRFALGLILTAAAIIYIMGDLSFSHQLIVENWGLGRSKAYVWVPLILALGLSPLFGELVYSRFIEAKYDESAKVQPRIVNWFFVVSTTLVILSFTYFGYVRAIGYKIQLLPSGQDPYEMLYKSFPHLNTIAFIALAALFLICGSVLLAVGFKELRKWSLLRAMIRKLRKLEKQYASMESHLDQLLEKSDALEYLNTTLNDPKAFSEIIARQSKIYHSRYTAEYAKGMKEKLTVPEGMNSLDGNFYFIMRRALQQMAVNGINMGGHENGR